MMETRSQSTVSEDMKAYFKSLIAPLATQEQINQLKMEITSSFEDVVKEQLKKIHTLEKKVSDQEKIIEELSIKCDLSQQYSRRSCLRIHGVEVVKGTEPENIMTTLEDCYKKLDLPYNSENIDRAHRIGKAYVDKVSGAKVQSIIVKFRTWRAREDLYKSRPRRFSQGKEKPVPFTVSVDLTKQRYDLFKKAKGTIKNFNNVNFVFTDIKCSLGVQIKDRSMKFFYSESELQSILGK